MKFLLLILLFIPITCYAGISNTVSSNWTIQSPPKDANEVSLYNYMYILYSHFNQLEVTTNDPNGVRNTNIGTSIIYNNAGTYKFCVETANPSGTVWKCSTLS
jgi:hypothetical protein